MRHPAKNQTVPNSVLAKRYSDFAPEKLKETYEKSGMTVLS